MYPGEEPQYSDRRSRRSSKLQDPYAETTRRSRPRSRRRSSQPPSRSRSQEKWPRQTSRAPSPRDDYPPSDLARGFGPTKPPRRYSVAGKTKQELDEEDAEMSEEDRVIRRGHEEAKRNRRAEEARSRSQRRSNRASRNSRQSSGERGYTGDERGYYSQRRRSPAGPPPSGSGYYTRAPIQEPPKPSRKSDPSKDPYSKDRREERSPRGYRSQRTGNDRRSRSRTPRPSRTKMLGDYLTRSRYND